LKLVKNALLGDYYSSLLSGDAINQIANAYAGNEMHLDQVKQQIDPNGAPVPPQGLELLERSKDVHVDYRFLFLR
jgi:hypothetical protein